MSVAEIFKAGLARVRAWSRAEWLAGAACAVGGAGLLAWAWRLWPEWRINPDLSHGFFALPIVVMLWIRARAEREAGPGLGVSGAAGAALVTAAGLGTLAATFLATVYAIALGWSATATLFLLGVAAAGAATVALLLAAGREVRWVALGWPALVIPLVLVLGGPLPPGTYARLSLSLQEGITVGVLEVLRLFGVPAVRVGNVINLGHTSVGVEEACSGVRSLISCVLAGLVLSALLLRSPRRRALLVLAAAPLALLTNFARSLTLTLLARSGVDIAGAWHDGLGFAVLGVTTALLAWMATALEEAPGKPRGTVNAGREPGAPRGGVAGAVGLCALGLAAGWLVFVAARTERAERGTGEAPNLARIIPAEPAAAGWAVEARDDLGRFAGILRTEHLLERSYRGVGVDGRPVQVTVYAAWWPAGAASVSSVATHTPDACWPGTGWEIVAAENVRRDLPLARGGAVGEAEQRFFRFGRMPQWVWYWHVVDGAPLRPFEPRSWRDQLKMFFQQGVRRDAAQAFVRLSANRPWEEVADEALVSELLAGIAELGVPVGGSGPSK
jgi:exosortase